MLCNKNIMNYNLFRKVFSTKIMKVLKINKFQDLYILNSIIDNQLKASNKNIIFIVFVLLI